MSPETPIDLIRRESWGCHPMSKVPIQPDRRLLSFYFAYNFTKIHRTLRTYLAMVAIVTDRLWSVERDYYPSGKPMSNGGREEQHDPL